MIDKLNRVVSRLIDGMSTRTGAFVLGCLWVAIMIPEVFRRRPLDWRQVALFSGVFLTYLVKVVIWPRDGRKVHLGLASVTMLGILAANLVTTPRTGPYFWIWNFLCVFGLATCAYRFIHPAKEIGAPKAPSNER